MLHQFTCFASYSFTVLLAFGLVSSGSWLHFQTEMPLSLVKCIM